MSPKILILCYGMGIIIWWVKEKLTFVNLHLHHQIYCHLLTMFQTTTSGNLFSHLHIRSSIYQLRRFTLKPISVHHDRYPDLRILNSLAPKVFRTNQSKQV